MKLLVLLFTTFVFNYTYSIPINKSEKTSCPKGTTQSSMNSSVCYSYIDKKMSGYDAQINCQGSKGDFAGEDASITSAFENSFILDFLKNKTSDVVWLGADTNYNGFNYVWYWFDGALFDYTNFENGDGNAADGLSITFNPADGKWATDSKTKEYAVLCKWTRFEN